MIFARNLSLGIDDVSRQKSGLLLNVEEIDSITTGGMYFG